MMRSTFLLLACLLATEAAAQDTPNDRAIRRYLSDRAADLERDFLPQVKSREDFERARPELRKQYFHALGLWPLPERTPLKAKVTRRLERDAYSVEMVHFQSRPGLYVTGNLYLPKPAKGNHPAILYACGHSGRGRNGNKTAFQDHGIWFATHGYVALLIDTLQLGEIGAVHHGTYSYGRWWWHSAGYTSAGVECWNGVRAIDYLQTRPEVDGDRIGVTGISGGGAATFWISAADERVTAAAPVSGMADLGFYVTEDGVNGHCDCMFLYNTPRWNWTTIAALVCPRPLLFVNSDNDRIFPMSANERVTNRLEHLYAYFGASDRMDTVVSIGGHAYRTDLRRAIFEFFNRTLKGDARRVTDPDSGRGEGRNPRIPIEQLRVFAEDSDIPKDQRNTRIDETFVPRAKPELPSAGGFPAWRSDLLHRLRGASFGAWPEARKHDPISLSSRRRSSGFLETEEGIIAHWTWIPGRRRPETTWLVVLDRDELPSNVPAWAKETVGNDPALLVNPRGSGAGMWTERNPPNTVARSMILLGATADGGRVWDLMQIARIASRAPGRLRVLGRGSSGLLGAYAALYEPAIDGVTLLNPPPSHAPRRKDEAYGPAILNILRVLDVPEALGCLAPRPLTLIGAKDGAFDRTAKIYGIAGASGKLSRK